MKQSLILVAAASMFGLASPTLYAHSDEYLDTLKAPHGGQLRMAGIYHFELVVVKESREAKQNPVFVYVTDHAGTKMPIVGAGGTATILAGKRKTVVKLVSDSDNRLQGVGNYAPTPDMNVVVAITLSDKTVRQARFAPLAGAKDGPARRMIGM